ncbi:arylsulfotransferase family protein [Methylobacillus arboreus]|uniref:arylsulfotransferase family protein n=1 Tax=Methylobacillus arboreus TaxID=755170 RepID=UPI001E480924|nr:arylsulfotransferase family protein [Methylobacillus arboreus]MCB5189155.1 arylsulfotransferase family protein [Methylobacillus arboreus]
MLNHKKSAQYLHTGILKKRTTWLVALLALLQLPQVTASPSVYPTGTTRYDPSRAFNSYVLFTGGDNVARLIDLNGNVVKTWQDAGGHSTLLDPSLNQGRLGHVLVTESVVDGRGTSLVPGLNRTRISQTVSELDWNGKPVWTFGEKAPGGLAQQHHDWARLGNGNTLLLANLVHTVPGFKQSQLLDDVIYEVNPAGEVVWKWIAAEHIQEFGFSPAELALVKNSENADYLHFNNLKVLGPNRWFKAGDQRFHPDNLLVDARNANFIAIIDKKTGKVVWSLGPHFPRIARGPQARVVPRPVDQISGQHDAHLIPEGLPGAGNLLVFDNQGEAGYPPVELSVTGGSRILEIDPIKKEIVWQYTGEDSGAPGWSFRSTHISNARRLPNGNTFINEGQKGRLFQVTPDGEIVWEYVNPYPRSATDTVTGKPTVNSQLYRGQPVPYSWVPVGTPHSEQAVIPPTQSEFHIPVQAD